MANSFEAGDEHQALELAAATSNTSTMPFNALMLRPKTPEQPVFERFGLLTPGTPCFGEDATLPLRFTIENRFKDDGRIIQDTDCAPGLAEEVQEIYSGNRRSLRVRAKAVKDTQVVVARPKAIKKAALVRNASSPESSFTAESDVKLLPDPNPVLLTLDWQLQYPPGGSTHASYPYPVMDTRLKFQPSLIPMVDGLPSISQLPALALPMGWRHVSWCGLLPIAFDSYHQAFKLTPVGPLPLTSEELQQGGLTKYVPGGECHPEAGLLPDMAMFSDGSDGERFDLEGLDWVLPFPEYRLEACVMSRNSLNPLTSLSDSHDASRTPIDTAEAALTRLEARACPDLVFDVEDAWRWLTSLEQNPDVPFEPTPTKQWKGSGAYRSARKTKSPIPEQLMISLAGNIQLLHNQDGRKDKNLFCPFKSVATPMTVDITLLADTEFTLMELVCYFPYHYNWGRGAERFARAGLSYALIKDAINFTRALEGRAATRTSLVNSGASRAKERDLVKTDDTINDMDTTSYTAVGWANLACGRMEYPLMALAHGLAELPSGLDAGPLTAIMRWCKQQGRFSTLLSEVPELLKRANMSPLIEPAENLGCPDKDMVARHLQALKGDGLRVKRSVKEAERRKAEAEARAEAEAEAETETDSERPRKRARMDRSA